MKGYRGSLCKTGLGIRSSLALGTHACNAARPLQTKWPWDGNRSSPSLVRVRPRTPDAEVRQRLAKRLVHTQCLSMNGASTSRPRCRACGAPAGAQRGAGCWHVENHIAGRWGGCAPTGSLTQTAPSLLSPTLLTPAALFSLVQEVTTLKSQFPRHSRSPGATVLASEDRRPSLPAKMARPPQQEKVVPSSASPFPRPTCLDRNRMLSSPAPTGRRGSCGCEWGREDSGRPGHVQQQKQPLGASCPPDSSAARTNSNRTRAVWVSHHLVGFDYTRKLV